MEYVLWIRRKDEKLALLSLLMKEQGVYQKEEKEKQGKYPKIFQEADNNEQGDEVRRENEFQCKQQMVWAQVGGAWVGGQFRRPRHEWEIRKQRQSSRLP